MSRGDWWSVVATLLAGGIGYFIGGQMAAYTCILVGLLIALILHFTRHKKEEIPVRPADNKSITQDNSATLTASPHIEQHQHFYGKGSEEPKTLNEEKKETRDNDTPEVSFIQTRAVLLEENDLGTWVQVDQGVAKAKAKANALVARLKNVPKELGKQTPTANSVEAKLVFSNPEDPEEPEIHISNGAWVNHYKHSTTISSGDIRDLVILFFKPDLVTIENPNSSNPVGGIHWHTGMSIRPTKSVPLRTPEGEVTITLVDGYGYTVFYGVFDYIISENEKTLTPR